MEVAQKFSSWISIHLFSVHQSVYLSLQPTCFRASSCSRYLVKNMLTIFFRSVDNVITSTSSSSSTTRDGMFHSKLSNKDTILGFIFYSSSCCALGASASSMCHSQKTQMSVKSTDRFFLPEIISSLTCFFLSLRASQGGFHGLLFVLSSSVLSVMDSTTSTTCRRM